MNKLCYVAKPLAWESPKGVACRTALHNGYGNVAAMCTSLGIPCHGDGLDLLTEQSKLFTTLATEAPQIAHHLLSNSYSLAGVNASSWIIDELELPRWKFNHQFRYCPDCLQSELISVFQDLSNLDSCPLHEKKIITVCPECHQYEHWTTAHLFFCACGLDRRSIKSQPVAPYDEKNVETFGPSARLTWLSDMMELTLTAQKIWASRSTTAEKNNYHLYDELMNHCQQVITSQLSKYPGFSRPQHLSAWDHGHPTLIALAKDIIKEPTELHEDCITGRCCRDIELNINQLISFVGRRHTREQWVKLLSKNFSINKHGCTTKYYRCHMPICRLARGIKDRELHLQMVEKALESDYLSTRDAATSLHCSCGEVLQLVELGYLKKLRKSKKNTGRGHPTLIWKPSIESFNQSFILMQGITKLTQINPFKTARILNQLGIASDHSKLGPHVYKLLDIYKSQEKLKDASSFPSLLYPIALPPTLYLYNTLKVSSLKLNHSERPFVSSEHEANLPAEPSRARRFTTLQAATYLNITGRLLNSRFVLPGLATPAVIEGERFYSLAEIRKIAEHLQNNISLEQAGKILNCGRKKISVIINSSNIKPSCALAYSNGETRLLYDRNEIKKLKHYKIK